MGVIGVTLLLMSYLGMPWISENGRDVSFGDIRDSLDAQSDAAVAMTQDMRDLEDYTDTGWWVVTYVAITAVLFATWVVPQDRSWRMLTWLIANPCLGFVAYFDKRGETAPRVLGAISGLYVLVAHGQAMERLFGDGGPDAAVGAQMGLAAGILIVVACLMGTTTEHVPAPAYR